MGLRRNQNINTQLKARIIERYAFQWRFAQHVEVGEAIVSQVVNRRRTLPVKEREKWARVLDSTPDELFREVNA